MATVVLLNCVKNLQHTNDISDGNNRNENADTINGGQNGHDDIVMLNRNRKENHVFNAEDHDIRTHARYSGDSSVKQSTAEAESCGNEHRFAYFCLLLRLYMVGIGCRHE